MHTAVRAAGMTERRHFARCHCRSRLRRALLWRKARAQTVGAPPPQPTAAPSGGGRKTAIATGAAPKAAIATASGTVIVAVIGTETASVTAD